MIEGENYTLVVDEGEDSYTSQPFAIGESLYEPVKYDALSYFYHNRSGTPILAEVVGEPWARPAGHLDDASVQTIECLTGEEGCRTLDASGGWYDAGDHGKYVVNGGISVWTLLNQYERAKYLGAGTGEFDDGTMALPAGETANGMPDLLDEARWEIEWFFKMQVPDDQPLAGMVHHKMHDENWTGLPMAPHEDPETRYVHPPSTAATLNFAAVGGQCFRAFENVDPEFADRCLARAITAYDAARDNPVMLAATQSNGGGAYSDGNVDDEFYWAAAELYLATGNERYAEDMAASDLHLTVPLDDFSLMTWQRTNALGILSMATAGDWFSADEDWVRQAREAVVEAADGYTDAVHSEGYALPLSGESYPWGSNSFVTNNLLVLGLAHDFTCDTTYADAMTRGVDYLFGRNPLGHSYITGYGERVEQNPHHRFWANAADPDFPPPPPGVMAGGPNSGLEDPIASALLEGCPPQRCFVDHIEAWSVNEITINWNSPFAWVSAYMDELGDTQLRQAAARRCELRNHHFSSFEDPSRPWSSKRFGFKHGKRSAIEVVDGGTDGDNALEVQACGLTTVDSPEFETGEFELVGDRLMVDVKRPEIERRHRWAWLFGWNKRDYWSGSIALTVKLDDKHDRWSRFKHGKHFGKQNRLFIGHRRLGGSGAGDWERVAFDVPGKVSEAFLEDQTAELELTVLTRHCKDAIQVDNIRFGGEILSR
jgi:endoglucanase